MAWNRQLIRRQESQRPRRLAPPECFLDHQDMKPAIFSLICIFVGSLSGLADAETLIVADEFPAMQLFADKLKADEGVTSRIMTQTNLPADLARFTAVLVYIHRDLSESAERAFIDYARSGGKLIVLHHTISSAKRKNKEWFSFLGVELPEGDVTSGGYKWTENVSLDIVNLAPNHFITTNKVSYPLQIPFESLNGSSMSTLSGFTLQDSEVYLNHILIGPRTLLLGLRYADAQSGRIYMQAHAGWVKAAGKGLTIYLMAGHSVRDFENPTYARIVMNAVVWAP